MNALAELDLFTELEALVQLRYHLRELARQTHLVERIAIEAPTIAIDAAPLKLAIGCAWEKTELALARLHFDLVGL